MTGLGHIAIPARCSGTYSRAGSSRGRRPAKSLRVRHSGNPAVVHYQVANLDSHSASRFIAVCVCAPGVEMITMLEPEEIAARDHLRHPSVHQNVN
jgi:hypothetical protein